MQENIDEAADFIDFGVERGIEVRFIERMPFAPNRSGRFVSNQEVKQRIEERHRLNPLNDPSDRRSPAVRYRIGEGTSACGFISPLSEPFCDRCNRMRLRGDGKLLPCLQGGTKYDLMPHIRPVFLADELAAGITEIIGGDSKEDGHAKERLPMSQIGG